VGAVAPSSSKLAAAVSAIIPSHGDPVVVELGPGTGAFTDAIQGKLGGRGRHLAIEQNLSMASLLKERHKRVDVVQASAQHLPQILVKHQIPQVDIVVSGLPWVSLPASVAEATLEAITSILAPDGVFTTFGYSFARSLAPAQRFRQLLINSFEEAVESSVAHCRSSDRCVHTQYSTMLRDAGHQGMVGCGVERRKVSPANSPVGETFPDHVDVVDGTYRGEGNDGVTRQRVRR
jgi:phospholipid N-methyltransferase